MCFKNKRLKVKKLMIRFVRGFIKTELNKLRSKVVNLIRFSPFNRCFC